MHARSHCTSKTSTRSRTFRTRNLAPSRRCVVLHRGKQDTPEHRRSRSSAGSSCPLSSTLVTLVGLTRKPKAPQHVSAVSVALGDHQSCGSRPRLEHSGCAGKIEIGNRRPEVMGHMVIHVHGGEDNALK